MKEKGCNNCEINTCCVLYRTLGNIACSEESINSALGHLSCDEHKFKKEEPELPELEGEHRLLADNVLANRNTIRDILKYLKHKEIK